MRLEEAYSVQYGEIITAERAYELYWAGVINDQRAFQCPGTDCDANITCANLYKLEQDLKVQPYYKLYGTHVEGCTFEAKAASSSSKLTAEGHQAASLNPQEPDVFHFSRPANHFVAATADARPDPAAIRQAKKRAGQSSGRSGNRRRHHYSVSNLVSRWLRLRGQGRLDDESVQLGHNTLTYKQLFKGVFGQDAERYADAQRVYWGKAWAERLPYGYRIAFDKKMTAKGKQSRPSLLLRDDVIDACPYKKRIAANLEKAVAEDKGCCILFVCGAPEIVPDLKSATDTEPYTRVFINFDASNLDFVDIHRLTLFKQLRTDNTDE